MKHQDTKGIVLIAMLLTIVLLTMLVAAGLVGALTVIRTGAAVEWQLKTEYAAEGLLELGQANFLEMRGKTGPTVGDSTLLGYFRYDALMVGAVWAERLARDSAAQMGDPEHYTITARAWTEPYQTETRIAIDVTVRGTPPWGVAGGFVALGGLRKNGTSGIITGDDRCGPIQPGIVAPDSSVLNPNEPIDSASWIAGKPPIKYAHQDSLTAMMGFDEKWKELRAGPFDYEVQNDGEWPDSTAFLSDWPVIKVGAGVNLRSAESGRGILIAPANLNVGGGWEWEGIVFVGNELRVNGNVDIYGTILSGLNSLVGEPIGRSDLGNGTKNLRFDSCAIMEALKFRSATLDFHAWRILDN